jgi:hypothetical protein
MVTVIIPSHFLDIIVRLYLLAIIQHDDTIQSRSHVFHNVNS